MDDEKTVYNNDPASLDRNPVKDMRRFIDFQHRTLALKKSKTIDNAFDAMEELLIGVVDFSYVTLQYRDKAGNFTPLRQFCPESLPIDRSLMEWILKTQEVSVLPIESSIQGENLHSLVGLPFSNHHLMLLWLEEEVSAFTQEQEALLTILTREMAAVLDTHYYRISLEKANAALADVIGSIPIGLISLGPENDIRIVNPIAEKWLGIDSARAIGNDFHQFLPQLLVSLIERLSAGNSSEEAEYANSEAMPELKEEGAGG
ncbi:MAG: hypothetical protein LBE84_06260, partial [Planctomycetota bacterium]|nr:hypothetical protein [Planctomycetota bacterium]